MDLLAFNAYNKKLELECLIENDVPVNLKGDPSRLKQILINLINNAIKFTENGSVFVTVSKQSEKTDTVDLRVNIKDTGIGISDEDSKKLFRSFSQVDASITRKYGGSGLGLAIVKNLVEMMNGKINFNSSEGKGSEFWFTVQFEKNYNNESLNSFTKNDFDELHVLVIEKSRFTKKVICEYLKMLKCKVDCVANESEGINILKNLKNKAEMPDIIFLSTQSKVAKNLEEIAEDSYKIKTVPVNLKKNSDDLKLSNDTYIISKPIKKKQIIEAVLESVKFRKGQSEHPIGEFIKDVSEPEKIKSELSVLIAEDNIINQKVAEKLLNKYCNKIDVVENGKLAVEAVKKNSYDLVFMDLQMPEMDGLAATKEIRKWENRNGTHVKIIALTANAQKSDEDKCFEAGMDDFISKPFKVEEIEELFSK